MTYPYANNTFRDWNFEEIWRADRGLVNITDIPYFFTSNLFKLPVRKY